jgi:hypothetical protein
VRVVVGPDFTAQLFDVLDPFLPEKRIIEIIVRSDISGNANMFFSVQHASVFSE